MLPYPVIHRIEKRPPSSVIIQLRRASEAYYIIHAIAAGIEYYCRPHQRLRFNRYDLAIQGDHLAPPITPPRRTVDDFRFSVL